MVSAAVNEILFLPRPRGGGASVRGTVARRSRKCWWPWTEKEAERCGFYPTVPRCCIGHQGGPQIRAFAIVVGGCIGEQPSCPPVGVIQVFLRSAITLF